MKKIKTMKILGFIFSVIGCINVLAGRVNLMNGKSIILFDSIKTSVGLFVIYLGLAIACVASLVWGIAKSSTWKGETADDKKFVALRIFSFVSALAGLFTLLGGFTLGKTGKSVVLFGDITWGYAWYVTVLGAVFFVIGALIWFLAFTKSTQKTFVLLVGDDRSAAFLRDYRSELGKISWLSRKETFKKTGVVLAVLIAVAAVIGILDLVFIKLINLLIDLV